MIRSRDHISCTEAEILEGFRDQSETSVRLIYIFGDGQKRPTGTLTLAFDFPKVPSLVKAGYLSIPVETYVPNQLRRLQFQMWGHDFLAKRTRPWAR